MLFKGRLRLPNDPGEGIPIDLEIEDVFLSLESGGEDFGEWRLDAVEIKRLFSNQFAMQLDGEEMVFIADDALGFAYDGLSAIEDVKSRLSKRRIFKGRKPKKKSVAGRSEPDTEPEPEAEEAPSPPTSVPDPPMPEVVPFFPQSSPSFADSVAESATVDENIAPVAPKPIEIPDATPPAPAAQPTVAAESPALPEPEPTAETVSAPEPLAPQMEVNANVEPPPAAAAATPETYEDDDDELVIEDVSAYGYVPVASVPVEQQPVTVEPEASDDDIEIEDAAPATGAVLREVHPLGEPESADTPEVHLLGEPRAEGSADVDPEPAAGPDSAEPEPDVAPSQTPTRSVEPAPPQGDSSFFAQWSSNGHAEPESDPEPEPEVADASDGPQTQKSGRHARTPEKSRSSLFGRKKSREPEAHEHNYDSSKTVGGITRRVCAICGHVSFAGEDVYQDW